MRLLGSRRLTGSAKLGLLVLVVENAGQLLEVAPSHCALAALRGGEPSMQIMLPWVNITINPIRIVVSIVILSLKKSCDLCHKLRYACVYLTVTTISKQLIVKPKIDLYIFLYFSILMGV